MLDEAYIEHTFSIYSAYIRTRWKPGGGKGTIISHYCANTKYLVQNT